MLTSGVGSIRVSTEAGLSGFHRHGDLTGKGCPRDEEVHFRNGPEVGGDQGLDRRCENDIPATLLFIGLMEQKIKQHTAHHQGDPFETFKKRCCGIQSRRKWEMMRGTHPCVHGRFLLESRDSFTCAGKEHVARVCLFCSERSKGTRAHGAREDTREHVSPREARTKVVSQGGQKGGQLGKRGR